jgi:hypothetical protein
MQSHLGSLPTDTPRSDNHSMLNNDREQGSNLAVRNNAAPFSPGAMVVVTLGNPRDKFWGMILALAPEGLSLSGAELASFEDLILLVKDGEAFTPAVVFFPMHRIERIELDLPDGSLPSLSQRFSAKTKRTPQSALSSFADAPEFNNYASTHPTQLPAPQNEETA